MANRLSTFHLIYELLYDGRAETHPNLEPFKIDDLIVALEKNTGHAFGNNPERWADWFSNDRSAGTSKEKESLRTIRKIRNIEQTAMRKISKHKD